MKEKIEARARVKNSNVYNSSSLNKLSTVALGYHDVQYCIVVKTLNVACQGGGLGAIRAKPMRTEDDADS